jgi:hypothetical protein
MNLQQFTAEDIADLCRECDGKSVFAAQQRKIDALQAKPCKCTPDVHCSACQPSLWMLRSDAQELEIAYQAGVVHGEEGRGPAH